MLRFFLARNELLHPPHFFVVANQEKWNTLPGSTNVFQVRAPSIHRVLFLRTFEQRIRKSQVKNPRHVSDGTVGL